MSNPLDKKQYADDWGFLNHPSLPTNLDGFNYHLTERGGHFLVLEVKRGEGMGGGQEEMLLKLSCLPEFTVLEIFSTSDPAPDLNKNSRRVIPIGYRIIEDGQYSSYRQTSPTEFAERYTKWFGTKPRVRVDAMVRKYRGF